MGEVQEQGPAFRKHRHPAGAPGPLIQLQVPLRTALSHREHNPGDNGCLFHPQPPAWIREVVTLALGGFLLLVL